MKKKAAPKQTFSEILIDTFRPRKRTLLAMTLLYFSNYINFIGLFINYPIYYIYWNYTLDEMAKLVLFVVHVLYLYVMASILVKLLK